jgi:hypothetical protein
MAKPTLQTARKEYICSKSQRVIQKGEKYWKLEFRYSEPKVSAYEFPFTRSETTQSSYLSTLYSIIDGFNASPENLTIEDLESIRDDLVSDLESLRDETQDSLDNMPENLQYSPTAEMLQERIDNLDSGIDELENIDFDFDDNPDVEELEQYDDEEELQEFKYRDQLFLDSSERYQGLLTKLRDKHFEKMQEYIEDKVNEINEALSSVDE